MLRIDTGLMHAGGQPATALSLPTLMSYFPSHTASQPSSASTGVTASLSFARETWHFSTHLTKVASVLPTFDSHFWVVASGGMNPVSSPPNGSPGAAPARPPTVMRA